MLIVIIIIKKPFITKRQNIEQAITEILTSTLVGLILSLYYYEETSIESSNNRLVIGYIILLINCGFIILLGISSIITLISWIVRYFQKRNRKRLREQDLLRKAQETKEKM